MSQMAKMGMFNQRLISVHFNVIRILSFEIQLSFDIPQSRNFRERSNFGDDGVPGGTELGRMQQVGCGPRDQ